MAEDGRRHIEAFVNTIDREFDRIHASMPIDPGPPDPPPPPPPPPADVQLPPVIAPDDLWPLTSSSAPFQPALKPGLYNTPKGTPTNIPKNIDAGGRSDLEMENRVARALAVAGYDITQNPPPKPNGKKPDYQIQGTYVDCAHPTTDKVQNIIDNSIRTKVNSGQVDSVVVDMTDTPVQPRDLAAALRAKPVPGLQTVLISKNGQILGLAYF